VAVTRFGLPTDRIRSAEAGFDHHLTKPVGDDDLAAIAAYLKSLPTREPAGHYDGHSRAALQTAQALKTGDVERPGAGIFQSYCARCHQQDGNGVAQKYPRLAGNPAVLAAQTTSLVRLIVEGGQSEHRGRAAATQNARIRWQTQRCRDGRGAHVHSQYVGQRGPASDHAGRQRRQERNSQVRNPVGRASRDTSVRTQESHSQAKRATRAAPMPNVASQHKPRSVQWALRSPTADRFVLSRTSKTMTGVAVEPFNTAAQ
jgi:cytochrome c553